MFKKFTTPQRIQVGLILAIAFLLVLGSNRLDQRHFSTIQTTVNSVYKDRVVVQDLIYKLNNIFHTKELRFILGNDFNTITVENQKVEQLLADFGATKLTPNESNALNELHRQFDKLKKLENNVVQSPDDLQGGVRVVAGKTLEEIERNLDALAKIQLQESGQLTALSNKSLGMNILLSKFEVAFMIIIGIAMLALIFYPVRTMQPVKN